MQRVNFCRIVKIVMLGIVMVFTAAVSGAAALAQISEVSGPTYQHKTPDEMEKLVAPIALYPDALVAQILAASTYPTEVIQADRWLQNHQGLNGQQLATAVDQQPWDPSVKALTAFPSVLSNLDESLTWTSELGETYFNQPRDLMDAVQSLRQRAEAAGNLRSNAEQRVVAEGTSIVIEPAYGDTCYLPVYDPWLVYGAPMVPYPYFYQPWYATPYVTFGPAVRLGFFGGFGWGWPAWGFNWTNHAVVFNHVPFVPRDSFFFRRGVFVTPAPGVGVSRGEIIPRFRGRAFNGTNRAFVPNGWDRVNRWNHPVAPLTGSGLAPHRFYRGGFGSAGVGRAFEHSWHGGGGHHR